MTNLRRRILLVAAAFALVLALGTLGFVIVEGAPVFDSFYKIKSIDFWHAYYPGLNTIFYGLFEDNDPKKRLLGIANYNFDMSEFWEFSDAGMFPVDASNEAFKIGVNYIIFALTR